MQVLDSRFKADAAGEGGGERKGEREGFRPISNLSLSMALILSFYKRFLLLFCSLKHLPRTPVSVRSNQSSRTRRHLMRVYCKDLA